MADEFNNAVHKVESRIAALSDVTTHFRQDRAGLTNLLREVRSLSISCDDLMAEAVTRCGVGDVWEETGGDRSAFIAALEDKKRAAVKAEFAHRYAAE